MEKSNDDSITTHVENVKIGFRKGTLKLPYVYLQRFVNPSLNEVIFKINKNSYTRVFIIVSKKMYICPI